MIDVIASKAGAMPPMTGATLVDLAFLLPGRGQSTSLWHNSDTEDEDAITWQLGCRVCISSTDRRTA
jgi:hypothetical protein